MPFGAKPLPRHCKPWGPPLSRQGTLAPDPAKNCWKGRATVSLEARWALAAGFGRRLGARPSAPRPDCMLARGPRRRARSLRSCGAAARAGRRGAAERMPRSPPAGRTAAVPLEGPTNQGAPDAHAPPAGPYPFRNRFFVLAIQWFGLPCAWLKTCLAASAADRAAARRSAVYALAWERPQWGRSACAPTTLGFVGAYESRHSRTAPGCRVRGDALIV
ncbi:MAG: hypothetical protein J3K34DRAFT_440857 [Monoraphidium minutum]|nr:MAG: hypothetical protein J3K34DRAFT_440857 [Monoraphidium minutum]